MITTSRQLHHTSTPIAAFPTPTASQRQRSLESPIIRTITPVRGILAHRARHRATCTASRPITDDRARGDKFTAVAIAAIGFGLGGEFDLGSFELAPLVG